MDLLWLKSGEYLVGNIDEVFAEKMTFSSKKLSTLKINWHDIKHIQSQRIFTIRTKNNGILTLNNKNSYTLPQAELINLISGLETGVNIWKGKFVFGANIDKGNTDKIEYNTRATLSRHTTSSRIKSHYTSTIAENNNIRTEQKYKFVLTYDVYSDKKIFFRPIDFTWTRNPLQNINHSIDMGLGLGYQLIDQAKEKLELNLGPAYLYSDFKYADVHNKNSDHSFALSFSTLYRRNLTKKVNLNLAYKITVTDEELGAYIQNSHLDIAIKLTKISSFDIRFKWDRINNPLQDSSGQQLEQNDFRLIFGFGIKFN